MKATVVGHPDADRLLLGEGHDLFVAVEDDGASAMLAAGGISELVGPSREGEVRDGIIEALAPYRTPEGGCRRQNEWHYLVARA